MKTLRRLFITIAAASLLWSGVLGLAPPAFAQGTGGSTDAAAWQHLDQRMSSIRPPLSAAQRANIRALAQRFVTRYQNQPTHSSAEGMARYNAFLDQVRTVLTPAQQADFDAKRRAMMHRQAR